jgi:hypothetical protein
MGAVSLRVLRPSSSLLGLERIRICLDSKPTGLNRLFQQTDDLPSCVPPSLKRHPGGTGILTCFPSTTPFGLALGISASGPLTRFIATHVSMVTCAVSTAAHTADSATAQRSSTTGLSVRSEASVLCFSPDTFSAQIHSTSELLRFL